MGMYLANFNKYLFPLSWAQRGTGSGSTGFRKASLSLDVKGCEVFDVPVWRPEE